MIKTQKFSLLTPSATRSKGDLLLNKSPESSVKAPDEKVSSSMTDFTDSPQISSAEEISSKNYVSKTEKSRISPLSPTRSEKSLVRKKQMLDAAKEEHSKGLPSVFVVEANLTEKLESGAPTRGEDFLLGPDFVHLRMNNKVRNIHEILDGVKSITMVLFNGDCREINTNTLKENDPKGLFTEALLEINVAYTSHRFNDAESRVAVASALCLGTFGFVDSELADRILSPVDREAYFVAVNRVFQMSVSCSYHELTRHMILWGADVNAIFEDHTMKPLQLAERNNDKETIEILLQNGASKKTET